VARLKSVRVVPVDGGPADEIEIRRPVDIEVEYWTEAPGDLRPSVNLHFYNDEGVCLFVNNDWNDRDWWVTSRRAGLVRAVCHIPGNFLAEGRVIVTVAVSTYNPTMVHALEREAIAFVVVDHSEGDGTRGEYANDFPGVVRPLLDWDVEQVGAAEVVRRNRVP
jgi:lipopolysaccharide transport system ATP-binding protein